MTKQQSSRATKTKADLAGRPGAERLAQRYETLQLAWTDLRDESQQPVEEPSCERARLTFRTPVVSNPWYLLSSSLSQSRAGPESSALLRAPKRARVRAVRATDIVCVSWAGLVGWHKATLGIFLRSLPCLPCVANMSKAAGPGPGTRALAGSHQGFLVQGPGRGRGVGLLRDIWTREAEPDYKLSYYPRIR